MHKFVLSFLLFFTFNAFGESISFQEFEITATQEDGEVLWNITAKHIESGETTKIINVRQEPTLINQGSILRIATQDKTYLYIYGESFQKVFEGKFSFPTKDLIIMALPNDSFSERMDESLQVWAILSPKNPYNDITNPGADPAFSAASNELWMDALLAFDPSTKKGKVWVADIISNDEIVYFDFETMTAYEAEVTVDRITVKDDDISHRETYVFKVNE